MSRLGLLMALLVALPSMAADGPRRFAVIVGANAGVLGRPALQYAHDDARAMAEVLRQVGNFAQEDVQVLFDPRPQALLETLDVALGLAAAEPRGAMLLFYYSGHADEASLYPSGRRLALQELKARLDGSSVTVRVGILDACRGGGWTGAKGLSARSSFKVPAPLLIESEGSVLMASSSGLENANEAQVLGGSIFTHHLLAGLRGAADQNDDGEVSASEVFTYARELTVRDSAVLTATPQHPSFQVNLKGREDLSLTRVGRSASVVVVRQQRGPLQLLQVSNGKHVVEIPAGKRTATVALAPGRYLALRQDRGRRFARAFELGAASRFELDEETLAPAENLAVATKGLHAHPWNLITVEPVPLFWSRIALGYERVVAPYWSLRADGAYSLPGRDPKMGVNFPYGMSLDFGGRYYFFGRAPEGLFVNGSGGLDYVGADDLGGPTTYGRLGMDFGHTWLGWKRVSFTLAVGSVASIALSERAMLAEGYGLDSTILLLPRLRLSVGAAF